jgi:uncharacterized protein DUF6114
VTEPESREGSAGTGPAEPGGAYPEFAPYAGANIGPEPGSVDPEPASTSVSQSTSENESAVSENTASESTAKETAASSEPALVPGIELQSDPAATPALTDPSMFAAPDPNGFAVPHEQSGLALPETQSQTLVQGQARSQGRAEAGAEARPKIQGSWLHRTRMGFRRWRRSRPFWGGFFILLGGGEILFSEKAPLRVIVHFGLTGLAGYLIPAVMVLCGVLVIFNPQQRLFYAILSVLLALATWPTSNLGGFFIGMLFGLIGGSLSFAWMPLSAMPAPKAKGSKTKVPKNKPPKVPAQS